MNRGEPETYNLNLIECKDKNNFRIINPKASSSEDDFQRAMKIDKNKVYTWIVAPKVPYSADFITKTEMKQEVLGDAKECAMMEIGGGFDRPSNPPPDAL